MLSFIGTFFSSTSELKPPKICFYNKITVECISLSLTRLKYAHPLIVLLS